MTSWEQPSLLGELADTRPCIAEQDATDAPVDEPVMAIGGWRDNADLIADVARLGYLDAGWVTLDPTYGQGRFWTRWRPDLLRAHDIEPGAAPNGPMDFTHLTYADNTFEAVVFDPPYKLNGTGGSHASDAAYGVANSVRWQDRMQLCRDGITECVRVLIPGGILLVKCQDQVCSSEVRWQTFDFAGHADRLGCQLVDMLHLVSYRAQPAGRSQKHSRRNYSSLLVLELTP